MKSLKYLIVVLLLALVTKVQVAAQETEYPAPPPPPKSFYEDIMKNESQYLQQLSAKVRADLEYIKGVNKERYLELLSRARFSSYDMRYFNGYQKKHSQLAKQEMAYNIAAEALVAKYNKSAQGERDKYRSELEDVLGKLFDVKEILRQEELKILEEKISNLRKTIEIRKKNKSEIIRRRVLDMLQEKEYFKWD